MEGWALWVEDIIQEIRCERDSYHLEYNYASIQKRSSSSQSVLQLICCMVAMARGIKV